MILQKLTLRICEIFEKSYNFHNTKQRTKVYLQTDYTHLKDKGCEYIYNHLPTDKFLLKQFGYRL